MKDYKDTLNLPTTDFPMKANLPQREPEILQRWHETHLYQTLRTQGEKIRQQDANRLFVLNDGPPYANGDIHLGHALDQVLKDMIVKAKTLSGFDAPLVPGWDCHGLPIELNVEKKLGKAGHDVSPAAFRQACREYATSQVDLQREELKRLGILADWEHPYLTMDFGFEANIIRALAKIVANGHVVQGYKPVHWCLECRSALAEAEVEYANKISLAVDVAFAVVDNADFYQRLQRQGITMTADAALLPIIVPIWTTTPWSLPGNAAVALNAEVDYSLVATEIDGQKTLLVLATELVQACLQRYGIVGAENQQKLASFRGEVLQDILLQHPFYEDHVPVVMGHHVTTDAGTGAVHTAPAHGQDDYVVALNYHLEWKNPVGNNGVYLPSTPLFAGEHIFKAQQHIIDVLQQQHKLLCQRKLEHSYPHCWRHKTPLIFLATPQWFIALHRTQTDSLAKNSVTAANAVTWTPAWGKASITEMIENRPDWCISRQRNWGTPMTLFVHKETRKLHPESVYWMQQIADRVEREGLESWFGSTPEDWLGATGKEYEKVTDILDVWFDSGVIHFCVLEQRPELRKPADLILEGSDQYRGWFQSSLLTAVAMQPPSQQPQAPYKAVITHGFTVDEKGRKMSKSLGNVIPPEKIVKSLGADILRLWVASTDYHHEVALSDDILKRIAEAYRRVRNTSRYLLSNLFDFDPAQHVLASHDMLSLDRWALDRVHNLQHEIIAAYDACEFHAIFHKLQNFCIVDLGGFYLDIIKDRQYTTAKNSKARRSAQTAMYHIAEAMVRWLAPILSFTAQEIWDHLPGQRSPSVFLERWYEGLTDNSGALERQQFWSTLIQVREAVNKEIEKCRDEGQLGSSLEAEVEIYCVENSALGKKLGVLEDELRFVLIASSAKVLPFTEHEVYAAETMIENENIWIHVAATSHAKCIRCWHRRSDVGIDLEHPDICARCVENVIGEGEVRFYA